jgi:hypothetical protein
MAIVINGSGTVTGLAVGGLPDLTVDSGTLAVNSRGSVLQVVNTQSTSTVVGTTTVPYDDTIPQITEGFEVMTLNITPTSASSKLLINVVTHLSAGANSLPTTNLFVGTTANALATAFTHAYGAGDNPLNHKLTYYMTSGSTSALTFRVRIGSNNSDSLTFNGREEVRKMGGAITSSITIMEVAV